MNEDEAGDRASAEWMQRLLGVAGLLLIAVTWNLWTPQHVFPQIPFFWWGTVVPLFFDWISLFFVIAALTAILLSPISKNWWRHGLVVFACSLAFLICLDQHRFQPWAYQFVIVALVLYSLPDCRSIQLLRLLTISIYFYSALSKLDFSFFHSHGPQLVSGLFHNFGITTDHWHPTIQLVLAALLPIGEFLVVVFLCLPRTRIIGLYSSIFMHILLMAAVGPWGLNHKPGVLLWNVFFVFQNWILFRDLSIEPIILSTEQKKTRLRPTGKLTQVVVYSVCLLPLLELFDLFDHWPAWGLYAARPERNLVYVDENKRDALPPKILQHVEQPRFETSWCRISIDRWSLAELDCPIYPQNRFQLGIALAIGEKFQLADQIRVIQESAANRWTEKRESHELVGVRAIRQAAKEYRLNAIPRKTVY